MNYTPPMGLGQVRTFPYPHEMLATAAVAAKQERVITSMWFYALGSMEGLGSYVVAYRASGDASAFIQRVQPDMEKHRPHRDVPLFFLDVEQDERALVDIQGLTPFFKRRRKYYF